MPELQPGDPRRLGSYELTERLGEGGQGVVYLGLDASGGKVAVKLLRADLTEDTMARTRFVREVQAAKQVARFCTAQVLEADVAGDRPYIASEYVPGRSLQAAVAQDGPLTGAALERLAIGTATALVAIHQAGIVHRDFKPHNVLMAPDGPRVIDFGIARALDVTSTVSTKAIGTPAYMAPEQVAGETLTPAVDIFAWGATMVFAATNNPPFGQDTIPAVINRLLHEAPSLHDLPDALHGLISDCLAKDPRRRPTAQDVLMRLIGGTQGASGAAAGAAPAIPADPMAGDATRLESAQPAAGDTGELPTAVLAEGVQRAGSTRVAGPGGPVPSGHGGPVGPDGTQVGGTGVTLPPVQYAGHPPGRPPGRRSKGPIIGAVVAVAAVLLLVGGLALALRGNDDDSNPATTPSTATSSQTQPSSEPEQDEERPSREPSSQPTSRPPTSTPPQTATQTPPDSPTQSPTSSGGGGSGSPTSGGGTPDGGGSGGDDTGA